MSLGLLRVPRTHRRFQLTKFCVCFRTWTYWTRTRHDITSRWSRERLYIQWRLLQTRSTMDSIYFHLWTDALYYLSLQCKFLLLTCSLYDQYTLRRLNDLQPLLIGESQVNQDQAEPRVKEIIHPFSTLHPTFICSWFTFLFLHRTGKQPAIQLSVKNWLVQRK